MATYQYTQIEYHHISSLRASEALLYVVPIDCKVIFITFPGLSGLSKSQSLLNKFTILSYIAVTN